MYIHAANPAPAVDFPEDKRAWRARVPTPNNITYYIMALSKTRTHSRLNISCPSRVPTREGPSAYYSVVRSAQVDNE